MNHQTTADTVLVQHTPDLIAQLWRIVRSAKRSDIRSVQSLLGKMTGNQAAAVMLIKLLYWFPRATKADGWVYKSWRDWMAECDLSQNKVKRVHAEGHLERIGIERKLMKANGTPTTHYRIDVERFLNHVAVFFDVPMTQVHSWIQQEPDSAPASNDVVNSDQTIGRKGPKQIGRNDQSEMVETAKSITSIYQQDLQTQQEQTTQQQPAVVDQVDNEPDRSRLQSELEAIGICRSKAEFLTSRYSVERLQEVLKHAHTCAKSNPAGFTVRALEQSWQLTGGSQKHQATVTADPMAYITGDYAAFIHH